MPLADLDSFFFTDTADNWSHEIPFSYALHVLASIFSQEVLFSPVASE